MGIGKKGFQSGNPGKPKGAQTKTTKEAKELFIGIMEGQVGNVQKALQDLYNSGDKEAYLNCLSKFFPYFIPKKTEVSGALDLGGEIVINTVITNDVRDESKG